MPIAAAVRDPTALLVALSLDGAGIPAASMHRLLDAVSENHRLEELNLGYNALGDDGAIKISEILRENDCLEVLDLRCTAIGAAGASAIASTLGVGVAGGGNLTLKYASETHPLPRTRKFRVQPTAEQCSTCRMALLITADL